MKRFRCWFDDSNGRYVLQGKELHCGDCFQILIGGVWHDVRIEMSGQEWYLYGIPTGHPTGPDNFEARLHPEDVR